jgi:hypothetical protein
MLQKWFLFLLEVLLEHLHEVHAFKLHANDVITCDQVPSLNLRGLALIACSISDNTFAYHTGLLRQHQTISIREPSHIPI